MSLRKRKGTNLPQFTSTHNETSPNNPSHQVDERTNYVLRPISYEDLDQAVWREFHRRFEARGKSVSLINLDAEVASTIFENPQQLNQTTKYVSLPYFTVWRNKTQRVNYSRVSPSYKPIVYSVPKQKPQGVVYEEWITPPPQLQTLLYTMKFITGYRDSANELEEQMMRYFKNKRNVILVDGERFEIEPIDSETVGDLEVLDREGVSNQMLYMLTFELKLWCYIRKQEDIQKREKPNRFKLRLSERSSGKDIDEVTIKGNRNVK